MAYHRGEPYIWDDGNEVHIWSNLREGETGYHSSVRVDGRIMDEFALRRFSELVEENRVPPQILAAIRKMGGNWKDEMEKYARKKPLA